MKSGAGANAHAASIAKPRCRPQVLLVDAQPAALEPIGRQLQQLGYRKGDEEFSVYIAYWKPGKMPAREVAFHIPDKCWTAAGLRRTSADYNYQREFDQKLLAPAQYREFEAPNVHQNVIYWHIYDGRTIIYNPDGSPSDLSMLTDLLRRGLNQRGEQFFIRISSPGNLDTLWRDAGFQNVMELIAPLGPGLQSSVEQF